MNFLSSIFGSVIKATAGLFIALGLLQGSVATTSTPSTGTIVLSTPVTLEIENNATSAPNTSPSTSSNTLANVNYPTKPKTAAPAENPTPQEIPPSLPVVNPNAALDIPQGGAVGTPVPQTTAEYFTYNGVTYNYASLPSAMSKVPQGEGWGELTTPFGSVWINGQYFSVPGVTTLQTQANLQPLESQFNLDLTTMQNDCGNVSSNDTNVNSSFALTCDQAVSDMQSVVQKEVETAQASIPASQLQDVQKEYSTLNNAYYACKTRYAGGVSGSAEPAIDSCEEASLTPMQGILSIEEGLGATYVPNLP